MKSLLISALLAWTLGCGEPLPDDVVDYQTRCLKLNATPIPERPADPHRGTKNVYYCDGGATPAAAAPAPPYRDGALIVEEATRDGKDFPWFIATMRKMDGAWSWAEYTRNSADEGFAQIPISEAGCTGCHAQVEATDWVFTAPRAVQTHQ